MHNQNLSVFNKLMHSQYDCNISFIVKIIITINNHCFRRKVAVLTDHRVKLTDEVLTGMRVIKMYCWENMFEQLISDVRE